MVGGELSLQSEHTLCALGRLFKPGQRKHSLQVRDIRVANLLKRLVPVIRLIGQAKAALLDEHHILLRITRVVVDEQLPKAFAAASLEAPQLSNQRLSSLNVGLSNLSKNRVQRGQPELLNAVLIHKACKKVSSFSGL